MEEKSLELMSPAELRAGIAQFVKSTQPGIPAPLPPGVDRGSLDPQAAEIASDLWVQSILAREPQTYSRNEREALRQAIVRAQQKGPEDGR